jgi:hypothetical protein
MNNLFSEWIDSKDVLPKVMDKHRKRFNSGVGARPLDCETEEMPMYLTFAM